MSLSSPLTIDPAAEILAEKAQAEANAGNFTKAAELARLALGRGLVFPAFHEIIAVDLIGRCRYDEAIVELGRGLALDPSNLRMMTSVGLCLLELERNTEAHDVFLTVLRQDRTLASAHFGFGMALSRLEDFEGAIREFRFTIEREPDHAPALGGLARLLQADGDLEAAQAFAERALQIDPQHCESNLTLARNEIGRRAYADAQARLRKVLAKAPPNAREAGMARTLLGDALDGLGDYSAAFEAYQSGNAILRAAFAPLFDMGGESVIAQTLRIARGFAGLELPDFIEAREARAPDAPQAHVFLVGFPRSGTTLLEQVLASHPEVVSLEERPTLPVIEQLFPDAEAGFRSFANDAAAQAGYRSFYWQAVRQFGVEPAGKVFIDKLPLNTARLPVIHRLFPDAKILFAVRDPRDVVLSCFRRGFRMNAAMFEFLTLDGAARYYDATMQAAGLYREKLPLDLYEIRYERLVEQFDAEAQAVLAFLGLTWSDEVRGFAERARARMIRTPSAPQVRRGLYRDALAQWRNYADALQPVLPTLEPWVERYRYPRS
jgi:tetratricopeptide (TPR) repeat protein